MSPSRYSLVLLITSAWSLGAIWLLRPLVDRARPTVPSHQTVLTMAEAVLRNADRFYGAQIGYSQATPSTVLAWRVIFESPSADSTFKAIVASATLSGKLYALAGLYITDSVAYRAAVHGLRAGGGFVPTFIHCDVSDWSLEALLADMDRGLWTDEFIEGRLMHH